MEVLFAHTYLFLFGRLAVGGLLSLAVPPFFELERGFFRSTAAVYLGSALLMASGLAYLRMEYAGSGTAAGSTIALSLWGVFFLIFTAYYVTLFVELPFLRARLFPLALLVGFAGVWATAATYVPDGVSTLAAVPFGLGACAGAGLVGAGVSGMLLGHWYLIEHDLDLAPLTRMLGFCRACLVAEVACVLAGGAVLWLWPGSPWSGGFAALQGGRYAWLVAGRITCWGLAGYLLLLIRKTLEIPQTMAATGLFYIEALVGAVGQILGLWLLFRTGLPL
jgi:hypothetical protein